MAELTREQKIEIYHKKKSGVSNSSLSKQYGIAESGIRYLIKQNKNLKLLIKF